ncbi:hypothetical protein R1flu_025093 [Riccia fluitans]|uniref:Uncharacterized protein n=1 Tax=Riccia fluitans TaxID=41844 RepID=A0ABD1XWS3_9MARC
MSLCSFEGAHLAHGQMGCAKMGKSEEWQRTHCAKLFQHNMKKRPEKINSAAESGFLALRRGLPTPNASKRRPGAERKEQT